MSQSKTDYSQFCVLNGKLFFSNAESYSGQCVNGKANGWGTLTLDDQRSLKAYFKENKIQNNIIELRDEKNKTITIGPNISGNLNGPCIHINYYSNYVSLQNLVDGYSVGNAKGFYKIASPVFTRNEKISIRDSRNSKAGIQIPNTKRIIFVSEREYNNAGDKKYWITLFNIENNSLIYNFGNAENPLTKDEFPSFIGFNPTNEFAYFSVDDSPKRNFFIKCNLKNGTKEIQYKIPSFFDSIVKNNVFIHQLQYKNLWSLSGGAYGEKKCKFVKLSDGSYIKAYTTQDPESFGTPDERKSILVRYSSNHEIIKEDQFDNVNIIDFAVDENHGRIAVEYASKDSIFLRYLNLTDCTLYREIFAKKLSITDANGKKDNTTYGKLRFSNTGTYLCYSYFDNTTIFLGNEIYFGTDGGIYGFNEKDNIILTNTAGTVSAYDLEKRVIIWQFEIKEDRANTGFYKYGNECYIISGRELDKNGIRINSFNLPEPLIDILKFERDPSYYTHTGIKKQEEIKHDIPVANNKKETSEKKPNHVSDNDKIDELAAYLFLYILANSSRESDHNSNRKIQYNKSEQSGPTSHPCPDCNHSFDKPYLNNCVVTKRKEKRVGYVLCGTCWGYGYLTTNRDCGCGGWCYERDCYVSGCEGGWYECRRCNGTGEIVY